MQGYIEALNKYDISLDRSKIIRCGNDDKKNYKQIKKLLSGEAKVDGIFSSIEKFALITYNVCRDISLKIPDDLKVICFSNLATADFLNPPLTTITQPANEMGVAAASQLFKYLDKNRSDIPNENIIIKSKLMARGSTSIA